MKTAEVVSLQRYIEIRYPHSINATFAISLQTYNELMRYVYPPDEDHLKVFYCFHDIHTNTKNIINLRNACYIREISRDAYEEPERFEDSDGNVIIHCYTSDIFTLLYAHDLSNVGHYNFLVNKFTNYEAIEQYGDFVRIEGDGDNDLHIKYSEVDRIEIK